MFEALKSQFQKIGGRKITSLFEDENRATEFSLRSGKILFDYSKTNIDSATQSALLDLLEVSRFSPVSYTHLTLPTNREV